MRYRTKVSLGVLCVIACVPVGAGLGKYLALRQMRDEALDSFRDSEKPIKLRTAARNYLEGNPISWKLFNPFYRVSRFSLDSELKLARDGDPSISER